MNILIIGTTLDDISYLKTKLTDAREEVLHGQFQVSIGQYAARNVVLAYSGYGQELASIATSLLIEKYKPYFVINVGTVNSIHPSLSQGMLLLTERIYLSQVSMMELNKSKYGQFPSLPPFFQCNYDLFNKMMEVQEHIRKTVLPGTILSSNIFYTKYEEIEELLQKHYLKVEHVFATDTESGGVALACHLFDVPYVGIKVCNYEVGKENQLISRVRMGVKETPIMGQLLTLFLKEFQPAQEM